MGGWAVGPGGAGQAALVDDIEVVAIDHVTKLRELGEGTIEPVPHASPLELPADDVPDLADLRGHPVLRRCLEIAAAGGHSLLLIGPPGGGKTLALQRLPSLPPPCGGGGG